MISALALIAGACSGGAGTTAVPAAGLAPTTETVPTASDCSERMAFDQDLRVDSGVYGTSERVRVHITPCPNGADIALPVLYLLHGANADETQWIAIGGLDEADKAVRDGRFPPAIIVIPDAAPAYACFGCSEPLTDHLLNEIEPIVNQIHPVDETRRAIGGISRGGGLALEVAGFDTAEFVAVGGHSAVAAADDAIANLAAAGILVYLDVGNDDLLADTGRAMAASLSANGASVTLDIGAGDHDRRYWSAKLSDYFDFYGPYLELE